MKRTNGLDICLGFLIFAMIAVVVVVVIFSYRNYSAISVFTASTDLAVEKLEMIISNKDNIQDNTQLALEQIKEILDANVPEQKAIIDTNNYVAIILTLITVCLTLSTIIPYIVGKSVGKSYVNEAVESAYKDVKENTEATRKEVKEKVESMYMSNKKDVEQKYDKAMNNLQWAEAHLSRMTAYMLAPPVESKENPFWAIGWASKSLIRYITLYSEEGAKRAHIEKFCKDCMEYIDRSAEKIKSTCTRPTCDKDGIILRAFTDMFDVLVLYENNSKYPIKAIKENIDTFNCHLSDLYVTLIGCYPNEDEIQSEMAKKTKFTEFLPGRTKDDFISYLKEWLNRSK